jgi:ribosomal protein L11 methyltransferase
MPYHQVSITVHPLLKDRLIRKLAGFGSLGVIEDADSVTAFFSADTDVRSILVELDIIASLLVPFGPRMSLLFSHSMVQHADWNRRWKQGFKPLNVGDRFTIAPPWEQLPDRRIPLIIDPGMAFGTGHHETTRSCLLLMERWCDRVAKDRFLDVGTGTGILAIAAYKLGFRVVVGIDTDPAAIAAAKQNAAANDAGTLFWHEGDISVVQGTYNMIAANLIAGALVKLSGKIATLLSSQGCAVLSGILKGQEREVIDAIDRRSLRVQETLNDGRWVTLLAVPTK